MINFSTLSRINFNTLLVRKKYLLGASDEVLAHLSAAYPGRYCTPATADLYGDHFPHQYYQQQNHLFRRDTLLPPVCTPQL